MDFAAFLDMMQELLPKIPAGIHFLLFVSTMQRGGTCEAHGIGAKLAASRRDAERAEFRVQVPNIALKAFLNYQKPSFKGLSQAKA